MQIVNNGIPNSKVSVDNKLDCFSVPNDYNGASDFETMFIPSMIDVYDSVDIYASAITGGFVPEINLHSGILISPGEHDVINSLHGAEPYYCVQDSQGFHFSPCKDDFALRITANNNQPMYIRSIFITRDMTKIRYFSRLATYQNKRMMVVFNRPINEIANMLKSAGYENLANATPKQLEELNRIFASVIDARASIDYQNITPFAKTESYSSNDVCISGDFVDMYGVPIAKYQLNTCEKTSLFPTSFRGQFVISEIL